MASHAGGSSARKEALSSTALIGEEASDRPNGNYPAAFSLWTGQVLGMAGEPDGARPYGGVFGGGLYRDLCDEALTG